jgi:hypothetical protein
VSSATVYGLCERGELPYVLVVNTMRVRPRDMEEFVAARVTVRVFCDHFRSTCLSNDRSATSCFNLRFSSSSCFKRRNSPA